ncbi:secreted RxLR effector protein 161-like [Coccinella septempunctata]|uniref:secreted RxLR effector protein 161-like n=1 Tax=Coccinella septempunctata TaxID=41139 RepID=UPI001D07F9B1|nr:secreted RxLR effector protein 161-like [Coccinella septempunctata]
MSERKVMKTPLVPDEKSGDTQDEIEKPLFPYREAIGSLLYLSCKTRPDLAFAINYESRFTEDPMNKDYKNIKRTLRYLQGTKDYGIYYKKKNDGKDVIELKVYCDSDYAGDLNDRKSTTGYIILYNDAPIN